MSRSRWYYRQNGGESGPFSEGQIRQMLLLSELDHDAEVRRDEGSWVRAEVARLRFEELFQSGWYFRSKNAIEGPITAKRMLELYASQVISEQSFVRKGNEGEWFRYSAAQAVVIADTQEKRQGRKVPVLNPVKSSDLHGSAHPPPFPSPPKIATATLVPRVPIVSRFVLIATTSHSATWVRSPLATACKSCWLYPDRVPSLGHSSVWSYDVELFHPAKLVLTTSLGLDWFQKREKPSTMSLSETSPAGDSADCLDLNDFDLRLERYRIVQPKADAMLVRSLSTYGQLSPLVYCLLDDALVLVDGFKRLRAARTLKGLAKLGHADLRSMSMVQRQPSSISIALPADPTSWRSHGLSTRWSTMMGWSRWKSLRCWDGISLGSIVAWR